MSYYTVIVRENGRLLGRLTPEGTATRRNIFAAMLSRETAEKVAREINEAGTYTATARKF